MPEAVLIKVRGIVQGVGFRPFVYRLAHSSGLSGWVLNGQQGVEIHLEGEAEALARFLTRLQENPPPAARIAHLESRPARFLNLTGFEIRRSLKQGSPTTRVSPDLPVCEDCLRELFQPENRRQNYPYINCTNCGPRYSILLRLPYDRPGTTMKDWSLCPDCSREYHDPADRRFHAQPTACAVCGPGYALYESPEKAWDGEDPITEAARRLEAGRILAVKGLGGYHLACDALQSDSVHRLRNRKFRKEKPFALMVRDLDTARTLVQLSSESISLLTSEARPIVLAPARRILEGVAPGNQFLGIMLPYTPVHHLLFAAGAPPILVMTSANRSSEPIAYQDEDAFHRLSGLADSFLVGRRPIARRVDDSVVQATRFDFAILRRARGYAPRPATRLPAGRPVLAVGGDLKNSITLVVEGQAFVSQFLGDLDQQDVFESFEKAIQDLADMYQIDLSQALIVHDKHPQYRSTEYALRLSKSPVAVQHHRAHIASVLAEKEAWDTPVAGFSFDGTGYGDDGAIWGGEVFFGSLREGLRRVGHLRPAHLPGGDAAARFPVQAAAGFLCQLETLPDLSRPPFSFPPRYRVARQLACSQTRVFKTTSAGRLFDAVAALLGFIGRITFEGQAAIWLENLASQSRSVEAYPFHAFDFRPALAAVIQDRLRGRDEREIARAFHRGLAEALVDTAIHLLQRHKVQAIVLSGGVFQNRLLLEEIGDYFQRTPEGRRIPIWTNREVPPNDGGLSLGQAALAVFQPEGLSQ